MKIQENWDFGERYEDLIKGTAIGEIFPNWKVFQEDYSKMIIYYKKEYGRHSFLFGVLIGIVLLGISALVFFTLNESSYFFLRLIGAMLGGVIAGFPALIFLYFLLVFATPVLTRVVLPGIILLINVFIFIVFTLQIGLSIIAALLYGEFTDKYYQYSNK